MAGEVYGYIIGLVITGIIFISAVAVVPNLSYVNLLYVDQQQLRNTALETMKAILLQAGSPASWGSEDLFNQDSVSRFGLACAESSSSYVLDSDKVQRLVVDNPIGYVEYDKMRELLGLEGYGFSISILPPFNVTIKKLDTNPHLWFEVKVLHNNGRPIPNAIADTTIIYITNETDSIYFLPIERVLTNSIGACEINATLDSEEISDVVAVFKVTVAGISTVVATYQSTEPKDIAKINLVGDNVILTLPDERPKALGAETEIINIFLYSQDGLMSLHNGTKEDKLTNPPKGWDWDKDKGFKMWNQTFDILRFNTPVLLIFDFEATCPPPSESPARKFVLVAGPYPNWMGSRVMQYGGAPEHASTTAVSLHRTVIISGMTYIVELTLWKE